jgi:hypothetical protein
MVRCVLLGDEQLLAAAEAESGDERVVRLGALAWVIQRMGGCTWGRLQGSRCMAINNATLPPLAETRKPGDAVALGERLTWYKGGDAALRLP